MSAICQVMIWHYPDACIERSHLMGILHGLQELDYKRKEPKR
jgi:hypothetical protein